MRNLLLIIGLLAFANPAMAENDLSSWPQGSRALFNQAMSHDPLSEDLKANMRLRPTSDGRSYILIWHKGDTPPSKWLVSLHGSNGFATRDLAIWEPSLKNRDMGYIAIQWWMGSGDRIEDYYTPQQIYRELDLALGQIGVVPETSLLTGFSRGSANIYAIAALDRNRGRHYFPMILASSGGAAMNYPPTKEVNTGVFGATPFTGTDWITSCGERDENPTRDGCPAMRGTSEWIKKMGGNVILKIEDPDKGHGALNTNPSNAARALDIFLKNTR